MPTGDGLLVRLLPIGTIALDAFAALCAAARQHGNGIIEVTSRGSIQIRGLSAASAPRFAAAIAALGIAAEDGIPVLINPLAGLDAEDIIDAGALAADLRLALARAFAGGKTFRQSFSRDRWRRTARSRRHCRRRAPARRSGQWRRGAMTSALAATGSERDPSRLRRRPRRRRSRHRACLRFWRNAVACAHARRSCGGRHRRVPLRHRRSDHATDGRGAIGQAGLAMPSACIRCATGRSRTASASPSAMPMPRRCND